MTEKPPGPPPRKKSGKKPSTALPISRRRTPKESTTDQTAPEESALWRDVTAGIQPLSRGKGRRVLPVPKSMPTPVHSPKEGAPAETGARREAMLTSLPALPGLAPENTPRPGEGGGLDRRTRQRLVRGQIPVEGRLDLHGHTQAEAHSALDHFLAESVAAGRRCVLVITGRGLGRSRDGTPRPGVLFESVPRWLEGGANARRVLASARAQPRDGGAGALYVLLRRRP